MSFGGIPFAESVLAGTSVAGAAPAAPGGGTEVEIDIDPFTIEISGASMKGRQLIDTLSIDIELGRQGSAQFSLLNLGRVPDIGEQVRVLLYTEVLFVGAVDRLKVTSNNLQTFVRYDFECTDNSYLLFRRKIKKTYINQSIATITGDLMGNELLSDGVTLGALEADQILPVADADGVSIFEFLNGIANSIGVVFFIDNDRKLNFITTNTGTATPLDQDSIEQCSITLDRETYRNKQTTTVTGTASGTTDPLVITVDRNNNEQIAERAAIEGTSGLYSERTSVTHPSSNDTVQLTRLANAYNKIWLGLAGSIRRSIFVRTRQYGYKAGQFVDVTLDHLGISGTWVIQRLSMREESGRFLIYTMELNQTSLIRRAQELWLDVVRKGTIAILPPTPILTNSQTFATPGSHTFTTPAGVTELQFTVYGAGGGGGGGAKSEWPGYGGIVNADGSAGGGGGLVITIASTTPGEVFTVFVGTGGSAGTGTYLFESFLNSYGTAGTSGGMSYVARSGGNIAEAYGGSNGLGGWSNARFQQTQSFPAGRGGGGLFGTAITVGGASNGGAGGSGTAIPAALGNGSAGGNGQILVEW